MKKRKKHSTLTLTIGFCLLLNSFGCEDEGLFSDGAPPVQLLFGKWKLEKLITPSQTITSAEFGYNEFMVIVYKNGFGVEKTLRNDSLIAEHYWGPGNEDLIDKKNFTYLMKYRYDEKRYFKVYPITSAADKMEATGYVSEIGAPEDTVRYYYTQVGPQ